MLGFGFIAERINSEQDTAELEKSIAIADSQEAIEAIALREVEKVMVEKLDKPLAELGISLIHAKNAEQVKEALVKLDALASIEMFVGGLFFDLAHLDQLVIGSPPEKEPEDIPVAKQDDSKPEIALGDSVPTEGEDPKAEG
jgi:hypothetical protein